MNRDELEHGIRAATEIALVRHGLIDPELLLERLVDTDLDDATSDTVWRTARGLLDV